MEGKALNIIQQQFMQADIPIVVTRNRLKDDHIFANASPTLLQRFRSKRNPTAPKLRPKQQLTRHQTLDTEQRASRTRRISSSAASRRFPKDFFKDEACLNPIKSNKPHHKQHRPTMIDTFSHKNFIVAQGEYLMPDNEQQAEDTPKFKEKKVAPSQNHQRLIERLINLKSQDSQTQATLKYNTCPEVEKKAPLAIVNPLMFEQNLENEGFPLVTNFNLTLGIKDTLSNLHDKGQKFKKRKKEVSEKENDGFTWKVGEGTKRDSVQKVEGFRIRKKVLI